MVEKNSVPEPSGYERLANELRNTGVISEEFKKRILVMTSIAMSESYERGRATGKIERQKALPQTGMVL